MTDTDAPNGLPENAEGPVEHLDRDLTEMLDALRDPDSTPEPGPERSAGVGAGMFGRLVAEESPVPESPARPQPVEEAPMPTHSTEELPAEPAPAAAPEHPEHPWADATGEFAAAGEPPLAVPASDVTAVIPAVTESPRELDMGPQKRRRWWVWAVVIAVVLAVGGTGGYAWWWTTSREIIAPDVVGKNPADATQTLNDVGLRLGKVSEVPTDAAPVGTIISQNPEAGSRLKPEDTLSFVVAATPEQAKVPSVVGVSAEQAAASLAEARLRPFEVASHNATVAAGFVIAQLPDSGTELPPGTPVALVVSRGPAPTAATVPKVTGMAEGDAMTLLKAVGLQPRVYRSPDASLAVGVVGTQTPLPGVGAVPGSVVQVLVSQGAVNNPVTVPDVGGKTRAEAAAALKAKGLVAQTVLVANATVARGKVVSQMPLAGGRSAPGGTVGVLVSRGNVNEGPVPSIIGTVSAEATRAISAAGFRPVVLTVPIAGQAAGNVFAQFPASGLVYPFRFPVVCLVAKAPGS